MKLIKVIKATRILNILYYYINIYIYIMSNEIVQINKFLQNTYDDRKKLLKWYQSKKIDDLRDNYNNYINENDRDISMTNRTKIILDNLKIKVNNLIQDGLTIINNTINIDNEITAELNKSQVGTLQGITRQTVVKNEIKPEQDDVVAQAVLEQPYNEREDINRNANTGGRKRKTKTNKKSRKTNKKSRKNKFKY